MRGDVDGNGNVLLRIGAETATVFVAVLVFHRLVHVPDAAIAIADGEREVVGFFGRGGVGAEGERAERDAGSDDERAKRTETHAKKSGEIEADEEGEM